MREFKTRCIVSLNLLAATIGACMCAGAALAQSAAVKPYPRVSVTFTAVTPDAALKALIEGLRKAATEDDVTTIEKSLAQDLQVVVCRSDPLLPCAPGAPDVKSADQSKPAAQRLRETICCPGVPEDQITDELRKETITGHIAGALESGQTTGHETPGLVCMPSWAIYDRAKAKAIIAATGADPLLLRYASEPIKYRDTASEKAAVSGTIPKGDLVPMLSDIATNMPDGWYGIALPSGKIAYTDAIGLEELTPSGTCFRKDPTGWKIALVMAIE